MKPSIFTSFDRNVPFPEALAMIGRAGFEVVALDAYPGYSGYGTRAGRAEIKRLLAEHGLRVRAMHAPFPEGDRLFSLDEEERLKSVRQCRMAVDTAAEFEAGVVALHLVPRRNADRDTERRMVGQGMKSLDGLLDYASAQGISLALENGQTADYDRVLEYMLAQYDTPTLGFCYDSGHENVRGVCFEILEKHASRLQCLHIHDNRCDADEHLLPYEGTIDWDRFGNIIHHLDFEGDLLLESHPLKSRFKDPQVFLREAMARARRLLKSPVPCPTGS